MSNISPVGISTLVPGVMAKPFLPTGISTSLLNGVYDRTRSPVVKQALMSKHAEPNVAYSGI